MKHDRKADSPNPEPSNESTLPQGPGTETVDISALKQDEHNFNRGREEGQRLIEKSFAELGAGRSILLDRHNNIIAGNKSQKAAMKAGIKRVRVIETDGKELIAVRRTDVDIDSEEGRKLALADNSTTAANLDWNMEEMATECDKWGIDAADWGVSDMEAADGATAGEEAGEALETNLADRFVIPPFTVLDSRSGRWQDRKRAWNEKIGDNGESREGLLGFSNLRVIKNNVSILDAVLAEVVCKWFGVEGGTAFDCFAGDSVFGFVASSLGLEFTGIELRPEQAKINNERAAGLSARYICDDGRNVAKHIPPESQDLLFSCPPYFDLEKYSDLPNDASNQPTYEAFLGILREAFSGAVKCLRNNRFAVIVVGDIRDKNGLYRLFPDDIVQMFRSFGMPLYNKLVLVNVCGSAPLRANNAMKSRKVIKVHQDVLVFYKGNPSEIKKNFKEIVYESEDLASCGVDIGDETEPVEEDV